MLTYFERLRLNYPGTWCCDSNKAYLSTFVAWKGALAALTVINVLCGGREGGRLCSIVMVVVIMADVQGDVT